jgi:hypothetical protein
LGDLVPHERPADRTESFHALVEFHAAVARRPPLTVLAADHVGDDDGEDDTGFPLGRIEYVGDPDTWAFAIYQPSTDDYHATILPSGHPTGTPTQAVDCACHIPLANQGNPA